MLVSITFNQLKASSKQHKLLQDKLDYLAQLHEGIMQCEVVLYKSIRHNRSSYDIEAVLYVLKRPVAVHVMAPSFESALHKMMHELEHPLHRFQEEFS